MVSTFEVDILGVLDVNGHRPSVGDTTIRMRYCVVSEGAKDSTILMPCWIVSEGRKDSSTEVDCPSIFLDKLAQLHKKRWELNIKDSIIFELDSWWKELYLNKAGNALDDDGEDSGENDFVSLRHH